MKFVCTNCGGNLNNLCNQATTKAKLCEKCNHVADKYIEFEPMIVLVDALLLSDAAYRHILHNGQFKLYWKLSLVLLLLESFALWREKRMEVDPNGLSFAHNDGIVHERGFYICCLQNILDYFLLTTLLLLAILLLRVDWTLQKSRIHHSASLLMKSIAIANFSKFFLLPIMVWRENTTRFGYELHQLLVLSHHLTALTFIFIIVYTNTATLVEKPPEEQSLTPKTSRLNKFQASLIILPIYFFKEYLKSRTSAYIEMLL